MPEVSGEASRLAWQRGLVSRDGLERVRAAVENSDLLQLCRLYFKDPETFGKYPCRREGELWWPNGQKAKLKLRGDQTLRLRKCGFKAHPEVNRGGRCDKLLLELDSEWEPKSGLVRAISAWLQRLLETSWRAGEGEDGCHGVGPEEGASQ